MTTSPLAVDHHQRACDALERSAPILLAAMRNAPATVRPKKMRWTNGDIAAHLYMTISEGEKAVRGDPSMIQGVEPSAALDEQLIAQVPERDPAVLADMTSERTTAFLAAARSRPSGDAVGFPRATVTTLVALFALDHHLHGGQFTETVGTAWAGNVADMHAPLRAVLPYAFDPAAAQSLRGSFTLSLRGVEPLRYAIVDGALQMDCAGRTDCTITADPQAFLRYGIGIVSQLRATLTGKMRAGSRKPWLTFSLDRLFPPIPHGGVAK